MRSEFHVRIGTSNVIIEQVLVSFMNKIKLGFVLLLSFFPYFLIAQDFSPGKITDPVQCLDHPDQSYALYLPSNYNPAKKWPILYCFDADAEGKNFLERFREGAEKYGWIVVSSNNAKSDDPTAPNMQAMTAMWEDSHRRLPIDEKRSYATGFSGGARVACDMGYRYRGAVAGVIGCGAGFPQDHLPEAGTPFSYFATIGERDFNFYELRALAAKLTQLELPFRIRSFDGGHQWPPASLGTEAIRWMEIQAMKKNLRSKDAAIVQEAHDQLLKEATEQEKAGHAYEAAELYSEIASDSEGFLPVQDEQQKAQQLKTSAAYAAATEQYKRWDRQAADLEVKLGSVIRSLHTSSRVPSADAVMAFLDIPALKAKQADKSDPAEARNAQRLLDKIGGQTGFYLPRTFLEMGDYPRAAVVLSVAVTVHPDWAWDWYALGKAYCQMDQKQKALDALKTAVDAGFDDPDAMESNVDLRPLKDEKDFHKFVSRARENAKKNPSQK